MLFEKVSFFKWFAAILTYQRSQLPVFLYIQLLFFMLFLCIKSFVKWEMCVPRKQSCKKGKLSKDFLIPFIIQLNKWLFSFLTLIIFIYIFKNLYVFMYRTALPMFNIYLNVIRYALIVSILYVFTALEVIIPLVKRGHTFKKAQDFYHLYILKRWKKVLPVYAVQFFIIILSALLFSNLINKVENLNNKGIFSFTGRPMYFTFFEVSSMKQLLFNISLFPVVFIFSNILYSPLIYLSQKALRILKINIKETF